MQHLESENPKLREPPFDISHDISLPLLERSFLKMTLDASEAIRGEHIGPRLECLFAALLRLLSTTSIASRGSGLAEICRTSLNWTDRGPT